MPEARIFMKKKSTIGYIILGIIIGQIILYIVRHRYTPVPPSQHSQRNLTYTVVDEVFEDKPFMTLIKKYVVVSGGVPTEAQLKWKLNSILQAILRDAKDGRYYNEVPHTFIGIYGTEAQAQAGNLWLGMIGTGSPLDTGMPIISEARLAALSQATEERFGLSEQKRKDIFRAVESALFRAECEAVERIPSWLSRSRMNTRENIVKQLSLQGELSHKYEADIRRTHDISEDELTSIVLEAAQKGWPPPPPPACINSPKSTNTGW